MLLKDRLWPHSTPIPHSSPGHTAGTACLPSPMKKQRPEEVDQSAAQPHNASEKGQAESKSSRASIPTETGSRAEVSREPGAEKDGRPDLLQMQRRSQDSTSRDLGRGCPRGMDVHVPGDEQMHSVAEGHKDK